MPGKGLESAGTAQAMRDLGLGVGLVGALGKLPWWAVSIDSCPDARLDRCLHLLAGVWVGSRGGQTRQGQPNLSSLASVGARLELGSCQTRLSYLPVCKSQGWEQTRKGYAAAPPSELGMEAGHARLAAAFDGKASDR